MTTSCHAVCHSKCVTACIAGSSKRTHLRPRASEWLFDDVPAFSVIEYLGLIRLKSHGSETSVPQHGSRRSWRIYGKKFREAEAQYSFSSKAFSSICFLTEHASAHLCHSRTPYLPKFLIQKKLTVDFNTIEGEITWDHVNHAWKWRNPAKMTQVPIPLPRHPHLPQLVHLLVIPSNGSHASIGRIRRDLRASRCRKLFGEGRGSLHSIHATCLTKPHTPRSISVPGVQMPSSTTVKRVKGILSNRWLGENGNQQLKEPSCSSNVQVTQVVHSAESALPSILTMPSFMKNKAYVVRIWAKDGEKSVSCYKKWSRNHWQTHSLSLCWAKRIDHKLPKAAPSQFNHVVKIAFSAALFSSLETYSAFVHLSLPLSSAIRILCMHLFMYINTSFESR